MNETADLLCWGLGLSLASEPRWLNVGSRSPSIRRSRLRAVRGSSN